MTRKIIPVMLTLTTCFFLANGQINQGALLLGGQIYYNHSNITSSTGQSDQKNNNATFVVSAGKAVRVNSVLGISLGYSPASSSNVNTGTGNSRTRAYSAGLFYRKYKQLARDFYFFGEFGGSYFYSKQTNDVSGNESNSQKQSGGQLYLTPGLSYKILNKLYLEVLIPDIFSVQYLSSETMGQSPDYKEKTFGISTSLNASSALNTLGIGFRIVL